MECTITPHHNRSFLAPFRALKGPMRRGALPLCGLLLMAAQLFAAPPERWAENRILVKPRSGVSDRQFAGALAQFGAQVTGKKVADGVHIVQLPAQASEVAMARMFSRFYEVEFAEVDALVEPVVTANDPYFSNAWHLPKIGAPDAWSYSMGEGVTVAILDTGVDGSHPDLAGKLVPGWNCYDDNSDTSDVYGHGTKVAGVVAAATNNSLGVAAIAGNSQLMPIRISQTNGYAYWSTIASGLTWAADHGADVANISYAVSGSNTILNAADYFRRQGGITVVAAGNTGALDSSAPSDSLISVSATTSSDTLASWSSYGNYVDVSAPGSGIWTTTRGGGYGSVSGTSFASPATAAVVALIKAANPSLSPAQVESILLSTADDLGSVGTDPYFGAGRIDAASAVAAAFGDVPPGPDPGPAPDPSPAPDTELPTASLSSPRNGSTVQGLVLVSANASDNIGVAAVEFYLDGSRVGTDSSAPWEFSWDTTRYPDGPVQLACQAYDAAGNRGSSSQVEVNVDNVPEPADTQPPAVSITDPANDSAIDGTVKINAIASDNQALVLFELRIDGSMVVSTNAGSISYSWNTRKAADGPHTIEVRAVDASGNQARGSIVVNKASGNPRGKPKEKK